MYSNLEEKSRNSINVSLYEKLIEALRNDVVGNRANELNSLLNEVTKLSALRSFLLEQGEEWSAFKKVLLIEKDGKYYIDDEQLPTIFKALTEHLRRKA